MANTALPKAGLEFISATAASGASTVEFTGLDTSHFAYYIAYDHIDGSADNYLTMRVSTDGGSTYISTASYSVSWSASYGASSTESGTGTGTSTSITLETTSAGGASANEHSSGIIEILNPNATGYTHVISRGGGFRTDGAIFTSLAGGYNTSTTAVDAVRILPNTGTITGNFYFYKSRIA